jgi:hypothetical protein
MNSIQNLDSLSHASIPIPGLVDALKDAKTQATNGTSSVRDAVAKAFTQVKANHVSTSFLELQLARSMAMANKRYIDI